MEFETSRSEDTGVNNDESDYYYGSSEEECGLADAFKHFEAQAEMRTLELLKNTEEQLFNVSHESTLEAEGKATQEPDYPAYVYMSDQFRLKKPPNFLHWQQKFQYLKLTGSKMLPNESMDHIQLVPMEKKGEEEVIEDFDKHELQVIGIACSKESTTASQDVCEEIILSDGAMEEILQYDEKIDDEELERARCSPQAVYVEEVLDMLTIECFSSAIAPMLTSLYKALNSSN